MNPEFFITDIEKETVDNKFFRKVLYTAKNQQIVVMCIAPDSDIPKEIHDKSDQFIRIEKGTGSLHLGENEEYKYDLKDGVAFDIPAGTYHRVINNSSDQPLQLYTIYSPPHHPKNKIDVVRPTQLGGKCGCEMQGGKSKPRAVDMLNDKRRKFIY